MLSIGQETRENSRRIRVKPLTTVFRIHSPIRQPCGGVRYRVLDFSSGIPLNTTSVSAWWDQGQADLQRSC